MAVADYLLPGLAAFGQWTRAHLVELSGFGGSGEPPHELSVPQFGRAVGEWLTAARLAPVVLAGHSSGTQIAAEAAAGHRDVAGLVLASPTIDPVARSWVRLLTRWRLDGRHEPPGLTESHKPEWKRAGARRLVHVVHAHLGHALEDPLRRLTVPLLILRGVDDRLSTPDWARRLTAIVPAGSAVNSDVLLLEPARSACWPPPWTGIPTMYSAGPGITRARLKSEGGSGALYLRPLVAVPVLLISGRLTRSGAGPAWRKVEVCRWDVWAGGGCKAVGDLAPGPPGAAGRPVRGARPGSLLQHRGPGRAGPPATAGRRPGLPRRRRRG